MKFAVTISDSTEMIEVSGAGGRFRVTIGEQVWDVDARLTPQGISSLLIDGSSYVADVKDEEFVLAHSDNVEAAGFVQHLKLPHYVDFQSELVVVRTLRAEVEARNRQAVLDKAAE